MDVEIRDWGNLDNGVPVQLSDSFTSFYHSPDLFSFLFNRRYCPRRKLEFFT